MSHPSSEMADCTQLLGLIETDTFCAKCGFNLHTQNVWRDERLGIPICRCPECGAIEAAGRNTATASAWLRRLALLGLMFWIALVLAFVAGTGFLMFGAQMLAPEGVLVEQIETRATGKPVQPTTNGNPPLFITMDPDDSNPTFSASEVVLRPHFVSWITGDETTPPDYRYRYSYETAPTEFAVATVMLAIPHLLDAILIGCLVWFWRPWWRWVWVLFPAAVSLFSLGYYQTYVSNMTWMQGVAREGLGIYTGVVGGVVLLQTLLMIAGLLLGRPIGRFLVSVIVPPRARQLFSFLWLCDGKTLPPARTHYET